LIKLRDGVGHEPSREVVVGKAPAVVHLELAGDRVVSLASDVLLDSST
jgi:hypothetical protein